VTSFLIRESDAEYRTKAKERLTSHQLADFRKCPELFRRKKLGLVEDEDRPAYLVGRGAHALILEGREAFDRRYAVGGPVNPRTGRPYGSNTQAYGDWAAEQAAQGRECLTDEQHALAVNLAGSVRSHPRARELLADGIVEGVVRIEYCDMRVQARIDWFHPIHGIVDLKTCDDLTWFEADAKRYGYAHQLAFYRAVVQRATGIAFPVHLIGVEKRQPFRSGVWVVSDQTLAHSQRENEAAIERLADCIATNIWPTGYEETRVFDAI
jgi:hypothetical protein